MAEEAKNAQVTAGVNSDITELKSLTTLRKRVVSDNEYVSKNANAFRAVYGTIGVILRNDGRDFYTLVTDAGQGADGGWNTLRPFAFSLSTGRVSLRNGVDISGGALVSHNDGIAAETTGPASLIAGQTYQAPNIHTNFNGGGVITTMLMSTRTIAGKENFGVLSYRDMGGNWNELQLRPNAELSAGQYIKRNPDGWFLAAGNRSTNNNADRTTNGVRVQGAGNLFGDLYHYERIGKHHFLGIHVANGGADGWYEFRNDGTAYTNGTWNTSSDARMKTEVEKIDGALDKLEKISGYTYLKQGVPEAGVIAQEVESVLPQSVTKTELKLNDGSILDDARGVNINGVVALLIEAVKEERAARLVLESRLAAMSAGVSNE